MKGKTPHKSSKTTDFFRKVGEAVLSLGKLGGRLKRRAWKPKVKLPKPKRETPRALRGFFERRYAGWPEYVMFKAQLAILTLFLAAVVHLVFFSAEVFIFIPMLGFSAYLLYLATTQLRLAFGRDYRAYQNFVGMCLAIVWIFVLGLGYSPFKSSFESIRLAFIPPLIVVGFVFISFTAFRLKYGRDFTYGGVQEVRGRRAVVRATYDLCSNVKSGLYPVEVFARVKKGDLVKLSVERPMLGLRGAKVKAIIEKARV